MSNCIKITVYGLSAAAQNRLGGVQSAVLDIGDREALRLSKTVQKLSILNQLSTEGALGFTAEATPTNDAIFSEYATPLTIDNRREFYAVTVQLDGESVNLTRLYYRGDPGDGYDLELRRGHDHWVEKATQVKINELEYGTFTFTEANIRANWAVAAYEGDYLDPLAGPLPVSMTPDDYGNGVDLNPPPQGGETFTRVKALGVEDIRPKVSFAYVLQAGFCKFGWTIDGVIFQTDYLKRLWLYAVRPDYYLATNTGGRLTGQIYERRLWNNNPGGYFIMDDVYDYAFGWTIPSRYPGITNATGLTLRFKFRMQGEFKNEGGSTVAANFVVAELDDDAFSPAFTGELLSEFPLVVSFAPGEKKAVVFEQEVVLKPGQRAAVHSIFLPTHPTAFYAEAGMYVQVTPANQSLMTDDVIEIRRLLRGDINILDVVKMLVKLIDGRIEERADTKTVIIHPNRKANVWGETVPGYLLEEEPAEDINGVIVSDSIRTAPLRRDLSRYYELGFADSKDAYINSLGLAAPAHSRTLLLGAQYPDGTEPDHVPLLEPTLEGQPLWLAGGSTYVSPDPDDPTAPAIGLMHPAPWLPRMWDNTDGNRSFDIGPRLFYHHGLVRQLNPSPANAAEAVASFFFNRQPNIANAGIVYDFGYATQLATWPISPTPDSVPNVVFGTEARDLFTVFQLGLTQDLRQGVVLDVLMDMPMRRYTATNFRRLYTFMFRGQPVTVPMTDIRDCVACSALPTPAKFYQAPPTTDCCDRPCGCQVTTCDYYQDLGPMVQRETLAALTLSSFTVEGKELITTPLGLGPINIVDVGGQPWVTNLVDVLKSVGAPWFWFAPSDRTQPGKGKRFFSIKRPACTPFTIVFSLDGDPVYRYTQAAQEQKWMIADWAPFGYGANTYTEPLGCKTVSEY